MALGVNGRMTVMKHWARVVLVRLVYPSGPAEKDLQASYKPESGCRQIDNFEGAG